ncbi:hypothetical protein P4547_04330, partial [Geobacillus stearothermophilus]|uniref:hypothetical protein n=2 Tax=Geobacillus stearothermophilus TaxID=1422 RepID=UPI002E1AFEE6|nr:hypothetical protein [Geobacillus stearothermophilus]
TEHPSRAEKWSGLSAEKTGLTQNANAFWDQPPLFCLKYRRIALFSGRIESPKPLPPKEGRFFYET